MLFAVQIAVSKKANLDKNDPISFKTEDDLIQQIVRIAKKAKDPGYRMEKENKDMTREEACHQLSDSASLFE
jgi:hypothetical protein